MEIIVVDNCSTPPIDDLVEAYPDVLLIKNPENLGAVGRNAGLKVATGDFIVSLDDDVYGISDEDLECLCRLSTQERLGAVNFKVLEEGTDRIANWCHPCDFEIYSDTEFETHRISEGAVALRREALQEVGYYPDYFFISHEGLDLAYRLINAGWRLIYNPNIDVIHGYDPAGRPGWRRYYYDTRNHLWFALRNLSFGAAVRHLIVGWGAMLVYAVRDGFFLYWLKAVRDAVLGAPRAWHDRRPPSIQARMKWRQIECHRPGLLQMVRRRLLGRGKVRI
jgi:GT2 family glycosyltransferase